VSEILHTYKINTLIIANGVGCIKGRGVYKGWASILMPT